MLTCQKFHLSRKWWNMSLSGSRYQWKVIALRASNISGNIVLRKNQKQAEYYKNKKWNQTKTETASNSSRNKKCNRNQNSRTEKLTTCLQEFLLKSTGNFIVRIPLFSEKHTNCPIEHLCTFRQNKMYCWNTMIIVGLS